MFDNMTEKGFLTVEDREKLLFSDSLDEIFKFIADYQPPKSEHISNNKQNKFIFQM